MENNKNEYIIFLDLEANQAVRSDGFTLHEILQLGIIKYNTKTKKISNESIYCKPIYKINDKIKYLLGKKVISKCYSEGISKVDALKKLKELCGDYPIYTFGNYDEIVIKQSIEYTKLKISYNIIDFCEEYKSLLFLKRISPSLSTIATILNIQQKNSHNALCDAFVLFKIWKGIKKVDYEHFRTMLANELIRPRLQHNIDFRKYKNIQKPNLDINCKFIIDNSTSNINREQINNNGEISYIILGYSFHGDIKIYNSNGNVSVSIKENINTTEEIEFNKAVLEFYKKHVCPLLDNAIVIGCMSSQKLLKGSYQLFHKTIAYYYISREKLNVYKSFFNIKGNHDAELIELIVNQYLLLLIE